jgi:DNA-binding PadR family transcriptional regulator
MAVDGTEPTQEQRLPAELRRGVVALAVLGALRTPAYGYSLQQTLAERGFAVEQGTLYPLLRRLDEQGLLESDWTIDEARPRKYYRLSARGAEMLAELTEEWSRLVRTVDRLLNPEAAPDAVPAVPQPRSDL